MPDTTPGEGNDLDGPSAFDPAMEPGIPDDGLGTVLTIGTFDGVHRGHLEVLHEIGRRARVSGRRSVLVTFHPHPLRIVRPEVAPPLLTTPREKKEILAESGLNYAVFLAFTPALSRYSPRRFVKEILIDRLHGRELVIGYDHGFGRGRSGDADTLREIGSNYGVEVDVVPPVNAGGVAVSSTSIRRAVTRGDMVEAREGLGRPYSLRGIVVRGEGRGHALGFPTANIEIGDGEKLVPPAGIYAVRGIVRSGSYDGALHIGPRPTFQGSPPSIELHLIDFDGDIYGEEVRVDFFRWLRAVQPFDSVASLVDQMREDVEEARAVMRGR